MVSKSTVLLLGVTGLLVLSKTQQPPSDSAQARARLHQALSTFRQQVAAGNTSGAFTTFKTILGMISLGVAGNKLASQAAIALGAPAKTNIGVDTAKFIFDRVKDAESAVEAAVQFFTKSPAPDVTEIGFALKDQPYEGFVGSETQAGPPSIEPAPPSAAVPSIQPAPAPTPTDLVPAETAIAEAQQQLLRDPAFLQASEDGLPLLEFNQTVTTMFTQAELDAAAAAIEADVATPAAQAAAGQVVTVGNVLAVVGLAASIGFILAGNGPASQKALGIAQTTAAVAVSVIVSSSLIASGITSVAGIAVPAMAPWLAAAFPVAVVGIAIAGIFGAFDHVMSHAQRAAIEGQLLRARLGADDTLTLVEAEPWHADEDVAKFWDFDLVKQAIRDFAFGRELSGREVVPTGTGGMAAPIFFYMLPSKTHPESAKPWSLNGTPIYTGDGKLPSGKYPDGHGTTRELVWPPQGVVDIAVPLLFGGFTMHAGVQAGVDQSTLVGLNQAWAAHLTEVVLLIYGGLLGMKGPLAKLKAIRTDVLARRWAWARDRGGILFDRNKSHHYQAWLDTGVQATTGVKDVPWQFISILFGDGYYINNLQAVWQIRDGRQYLVPGTPPTLMFGGQPYAQLRLDPATGEILGSEQIFYAPEIIQAQGA